MRFCLKVLFIGIVLLQNSALAQKTVWRSDDLYKVEIENWFDIFSLSSSWTNSTNDDATVQFSRNGLAGPGGAWWPVYVNGARLETQAWDTKSLHLIPFTISQLDSVVIVEEPMLYEGVFTEKGGLFLYTKKQQNGFQAEGNFSFGNRSGDPGPYVYTNHISSNVERVGPISDGLISFRNEEFGIKAGGSFNYRAPSDDLLYYLRGIPYVHSTVTKWEKVKMLSHSGFVEVDYHQENFTHSILVGGTNTEDYLFANLYSIEVPVERSYGFAQFKGEGIVNEKFSFTYQVGQNVQHTNSYSNKGDLWLNWNQDITSVKSQLLQNFNKGYQIIGFESDFFYLNNELENQRLSSNILSSFYSVLYKFTDRVEVKYDGKLAHIDQTVFKHHADIKFYFLDRKSTIFISGNHSNRLPGEDNSLWFWITEKGFANDSLNRLHDVTLPDKSGYISGKVGAKFNQNDFHLSIAGVLFKHENEYVPYIEVMLNKNTTTPKGFNFLNDFDATFFSLPFKLKFKFKNDLYQEASYTYIEQLSGGKEVFSMLPRHRFSYTLNWIPAPSLKLWTRIQAQSSIEWNYLSSLHEAEVTGWRINKPYSDTYYTDSPSRFLIDLGMKKYIWDQKLAFSIDLRNILDQHFRYNPLSHENRFSLFLKAHFDLQ